jgi:hypothetical protein
LLQTIKHLQEGKEKTAILTRGAVFSRADESLIYKQKSEFMNTDIKMKASGERRYAPILKRKNI